MEISLSTFTIMTPFKNPTNTVNQAMSILQI